MEKMVLRIEELPPGFRFDPTDEELVLDFLYPKVFDAALPTTCSSTCPSPNDLIPVLDFCGGSFDPWQLHGEAFESYGQWYFYTRKTDNRVTENGYWMELDMEQPIFATTSNKMVGCKKYLGFYVGNFPRGVKTQWLMQEYHVCSSSYGSKILHKSKRNHPGINQWVLCRVQEIRDNSRLLSMFYQGKNNYNSNEVELSSMDEVLLSLDEDDQDEISSPY